MNFGQQTVYNRTVIFIHLRKFCILLHCQASHMEVSKRNSIKLRQTVGGKTRQQNAVKIWGHSAQ